MNRDTNFGIQISLEEFKQLSYEQKLTCFHSNFGIIPFPFPRINTSFSWFYEDQEFTILVDNLREEIRNRHLYEKSFLEASSGTSVFDIKPKSQSQRIQFNRFLLSLFLSEHYVAMHFNSPEDQLFLTEELFVFLQAKYRQVHTALTDTKMYLKSRNTRPNLKHQFVRVFYSGFSGSNPGKSFNLHVRHKFVELYLYTYGIAVSNNLTLMQELLRKMDVNKTG